MSKGGCAKCKGGAVKTGGKKGGAVKTGGKTKKVNPWLKHVAEFRKKHPNLSYKDVLIGAKKTYKKHSETGAGLKRKRTTKKG